MCEFPYVGYTPNIIIPGGYLHGVHNLTYGVDILSIRLMGVLQVIVSVPYVVFH